MRKFEDQFSYDPDRPLEVRMVIERPMDGALVRDFTYLDPAGERKAAYLVRPEEEKGEDLAAVLFVHWYETEAKDSNRTQFLKEAIQLAGKGVVSLLVETMWSDREYFIKRTQDDDIRMSIAQVAALRQAMDILLAEPGVNPERFLYVGHDFGGMYGVLMGSVDPRPRGYVIMAATPRFPDWFLYYPRLEGGVREAFIQSFKVFDPITNVSKLSPAPVLFQFAKDDYHVPVERAEEFFNAAAEPKEIRWYQAGHGLNDEAAKDRFAWIVEKLNLT